MNPPPAPIAALLREGFTAQGAGDLVRAQSCYDRVLLLQAEQPAALQLLGLLARRRGELSLAEDLMRRSLKAESAQPHVWNNLGNLLERQGRGDEALGCFDHALALDPRHADAHYNRARLLHARGLLVEAAEGLQHAQNSAPSISIAMLQLQAQIEDEQGAFAQALATLDRALAIAPDKPSLVHNRATLLQRSHRHAEALQAHEQALALGLNEPDAHYNRGNTLQSLGRNAEAAAAYRAALAHNPTHRLALYDLGRLRWRTGDADFDAELRHADEIDPASAVAPGLRAHLLWRAERHADSAEAFREALRRAPEAAGFHDGLGRCLLRLGDVEAGLAAHRKAVALAPQDAELRTHFAVSLLIARRPEEAAEEVQRACTQAPDDQYAQAVLGLAWRVLGDPREANLNDYQRLVATFDLPPPEGHADMQSFCAALQRELAGLHVDAQAPVDQTLRHGTQTFGDIFEQRHPLVDALKQRIAQAVDGYIAALPADTAHPMLRRRAAAWRFTDSWSSRLRSGGFHTHHVHPHGWISSAFYVAVPPATANASQREGWLQFGAPDFDAGLADPVRLSIEPRVGRLVLFPSMFWHGTTPFTDAAERLTIAFDVVPTPQAEPSQ